MLPKYFNFHLEQIYLMMTLHGDSPNIYYTRIKAEDVNEYILYAITQT
jgi:hypothetical protein